jgi:hypothetical protein
MTQAPAAATAGAAIGVASLPGSTPIQQAQTGAQARDQAGADTCTTKECKENRKHWHHEMPRQFRQEFEDRGINIDTPENGRVIPAREHAAIHGRGYNPEWQQFFANNPDATRSQVLAQRDFMVSKYGLAQYPRPAGYYPIK